MVEGGSDLVKDRTYHYRENGDRLLIVRLKDTSQVSLLVRPTSKADCSENGHKNYARLAVRSANSIESSGCLVIPEAGRYYKVNFTLISPKTPINMQLRALDPEVWIRDITDIKYWSGPTFSSSTLVLTPSVHEP
jgi:predicted secreted hydrolase